MPLAEVRPALTAALIEETVRVAEAGLCERFGIAAPRLAVAGLNPHAGEGGAMGREELDWIAGLTETMRAEGHDLLGPLPADTMFHARARETYDAAICMYHDQGLIPLKALSFDTAVNVTLGLPIVRTSVDHGTALDIAWQGKANPSSLFEATRLATRLSSH